MGYLLKLGMMILLWGTATLLPAKTIVDSAITTQTYSHVKETLEKFASKAGVDSLDIALIKPSVFNNFLEVTAGSIVVYVSTEGPHVFIGNAFDVNQSFDQWNLTQVAKQKGTAYELAQLASEDLVVFPATAGTPYLGHVTVFTDVDCGYCRKFHEQVQQINDYGVEVRYIAFPRMGLQSDAYYKSVAIWCAKDRLAAMTQIKKGEPLTLQQCQNPIAKHYAVGQKLLLGGTPTLIFQNGEVQPGYMTAKAVADKVAQSHQ